MNRKCAWIMAAVLLAQICYAQTPPAGILSEVGVDPKPGAMLPLDASFRNESGEPVRLGDYFRGKPVVLVPVYYECPMLCSLILNGFTKALRAMPYTAGREFEIVTFSFDPKEKTETAAEKRRSYLAEYGRPEAAAGWTFLTGDENSIGAVTAAMGYKFAYDHKTNQWAHASAIVVASPEGRISQYLYGIEFSARDLRLSLVTAGENKIGSLLDRVFLYCYHYDPETGKYGFVIMNVLRAAGIATVAALALLIVAGVRKGRRSEL